MSLWNNLFQHSRGDKAFPDADAVDMAGNTGASETIYFTIAEPEPEPFPTAPVMAASVATFALAAAGVLVYFRKRKRQALAASSANL